MIIVVIMSHGWYGDNFFCYDSKKRSLRDLLKYVSNVWLLYRNCNVFKFSFLIRYFKNSAISKIPKWIVYNVCRGPLTINSSSSPIANAQVFGDASPFSGNYPTSSPFQDELLLSWASEANYQCFRNLVNGSWFINELVKVWKFFNFSRFTCLYLYLNEGPGGISWIQTFTRNAGHRHHACWGNSRQEREQPTTNLSGFNLKFY